MIIYDDGIYKVNEQGIVEYELGPIRCTNPWAIMRSWNKECSTEERLFCLCLCFISKRKNNSKKT